MILALYAALAMIIQDVISVLQVQAEARNRAVLTGFLDSLGWLAVITTTSISVTTLQGNNLWDKVVIVLAVTAANFIGSYIGVKIGHRFIKERH